MNIACDDGRVRGFSDILIDSRKEAQKALIEYQNGNPTLVQKHLKTLVAHAKTANLDHAVINSHNITSPAQEMRSLVGKVINDSRFDFSDTVTERDKIMFNSMAIKMNAADKGNETIKRFLTDPPEAGSEERKSRQRSSSLTRCLRTLPIWALSLRITCYDKSLNAQLLRASRS